MIFVDTSVWVDFFRGRRPSRVSALLDLLDQDQVGLAYPVYLELLMGASRRDFDHLRTLLRALPFYYPSTDTWTRLEVWTRSAVEAGRRFGFGDLLIGAIAAGAKGQIWSFDRDFSRMENLGLVQCYAEDR